MTERTTIYIKQEIKESVQIRLIIERQKQSLSSLVNELLEKWLSELDK